MNNYIHLYNIKKYTHNLRIDYLPHFALFTPDFTSVIEGFTNLFITYYLVIYKRIGTLFLDLEPYFLVWEEPEEIFEIKE